MYSLLTKDSESDRLMKSIILVLSALKYHLHTSYNYFVCDKFSSHYMKLKIKSQKYEYLLFYFKNGELPLCPETSFTVER